MATTPEQTPAPSAAGSSRASTVDRGTSVRSTRSSATNVSPAQLRTTPAATGTELISAQAHGDMAFPENSSVGAFKPFQMLLETELRIEYGGKNSKPESRVIHQELLCCHSQSAKDLFKKAEVLREKYRAAEDLRKQLKRYVDSHVSEKDSEIDDKDKIAMRFITRIYDQYPLDRYRTNIQQVIDEIIAEQVGKKAVVAANSKPPIQKKDLKGMGVLPRLQALTSRAVFAVAERLSSRLRDIKIKEREAAATNKVKAAAQRRIITPGTDERTVRSLVHWLYCQGTLSFDDPEHLYAIHVLAESQGITVFDQQRVAQLSSDTNDAINSALLQGHTLQEALGLGAERKEDNSPLPARDVVQVVFQHVLKDKEAPPRPADLVVNTLALHLDPKLWDELSAMVNADMKDRLIKALLIHRQVKSEDADIPGLKSEGASSKDGYAAFAMNEQT